MKTFSENRKYKKNEIIIKQGEIKDDIFIVKEGTAEVFTIVNGEEIIQNYISETDIFGELYFILEQPYPYSIKAVTDMVIEVFDPRTFSQLYDTEVGLLLKPIIQSLAERVRFLENISENQDETITKFSIKNDKLQVILIADSNEAIKTMKGMKSVNIEKFPFRIGRFSRRRSDDLFHSNNLYLQDRVPYNISRSHFEIVKRWNKFYLFDRGSHYGNIVNDIVIGGYDSEAKKIVLQEGENIVYVGLKKANIKFKIIIQ